MNIECITSILSLTWTYQSFQNIILNHHLFLFIHQFKFIQKLITNNFWNFLYRSVAKKIDREKGRRKKTNNEC